MSTPLVVYAPQIATSAACRNVAAALTKRFGRNSVTVVGTKDTGRSYGASGVLLVLESGWQLALGAQKEQASPSGTLHTLLSHAVQHGWMVIPALIGGSTLADAQNPTPELDYLSSQQTFTIRDGRDFKGDIKRLSQQIEDQLGRPIYSGLLWVAGLAIVAAAVLTLLAASILSQTPGLSVAFDSTVLCLFLCTPLALVSLVAAVHAATERRPRWFVAFLLATILSAIIPFVIGRMLAAVIEQNAFDLVIFVALGVACVWIGQLALIVPYSIGPRQAVLIGRRDDQSPGGPPAGEIPLPIANAAFISYRRSDTRDICDRILAYLNRHLPRRRIFRDTNSILAGARFEIVLTRAITGTDAVLVLIGPTWLSATDAIGTRRLDDPDDLVRDEIRTALELGKTTVPVLVGGAAMPSAQELPADIAALAAMPPRIVRDDARHFDGDMRHVVRLIRRSATRFTWLNVTMWTYLIVIVALALYGLWRLSEIVNGVLYALRFCGGHLCATPQPDAGTTLAVIAFLVLRAIILIFFGASVVFALRARRSGQLPSQIAVVTLNIAAAAYLVLVPAINSQKFNLSLAAAALLTVLVTDGLIVSRLSFAAAGAFAMPGGARLRLVGKSQLSQDSLSHILDLFTLERYGDVVSACEAAIRADPRQALAHSVKAAALALMDRDQEALVASDTAIRLDPSQPWAYYARGMALGGLGRHGEALVALDEAIRLDPSHAGWYAYKGALLHESQRYEEAVAAFDEAIRLDPSADSMRAKGLSLVLLEHTEEALAVLDTAIRLDPSNAEGYQYKGAALGTLNRHDEALDCCDTAIRLNPSDADNYRLRGIVLGQLQRHEEALAAYNQALRLDPSDAESRALRDETLRAMGRA